MARRSHITVHEMGPKGIPQPRLVKVSQIDSVRPIVDRETLYGQIPLAYRSTLHLSGSAFGFSITETVEQVQGIIDGGNRVVIYGDGGITLFEDFDVYAESGTEVLFVPGKDLPIASVTTHGLHPDERKLEAGKRYHECVEIVP